MSTVTLPPPNVPWTLADGKTVHPAWRRVLEAFFSRTGGFEGGAVTAGDRVTVTTDVAGVATVGLTAVPGVSGVHGSPTSITVNGYGQITAIS